MNLSKAPWVVALALLVTTLFFANKACNTLPEELRLSEDKYQTYRALSIEQNKKSDAVIASLRADNQKIAAENVTLNSTVAVQKSTISQQAALIAGIQANEPPTTPAIEAMPIVINLRAQVKQLTIAFNLAQATIATQDKIILNQGLIIKNQEGIITEWEAKFNRADALRLSAESLNLGYKKKISSMRLTSTVEKVAIAGLAAGVVYGLVRK